MVKVGVRSQQSYINNARHHKRSSSGAVQEQKYLLHYKENDRDRNINLATTWAVTDLGNGDRNHGWSEGEENNISLTFAFEIYVLNLSKIL